MSFAKVFSAQVSILQSHIIDIEVDISKGLNSFTIVGLPDKAVEEAKDRVSAAIKNAGFTSPKQKNFKTIISLAPAHLRKEGVAFDVGIALAYLLACKEIEFDPTDKLFVGELTLDGQVRKVKGILALIQHAKQKGFKEAFVPAENAKEAALIEGINIYSVNHISQIIDHINTRVQEGKERILLLPEPVTQLEETSAVTMDISDIKGQETAKRGLQIAAAGKHNIALFGPPGTGKTMLARALQGILPPLTFEEMLEVTSIHSVAGIQRQLSLEPPFRSPHHTSSYVSVIGGGAYPKPGEITLAHRGVLFLDELPEFNRDVIDSLRQPLEERIVHISRARQSAQFPAHFILIAAMNPCPCGFYGSKTKECICSPQQLLTYKRKISGPIADRIDMWIEVGEIAKHLLIESTGLPKTPIIREQVFNARKIQKERFTTQKLPYHTNSEITSKQLLTLINATKQALDILTSASEKLKLSNRAYHRILKLARTIADLEGTTEIRESHILEALQYRPKTN